MVEIGHDGDGFAFDNESPRHQVLLHPFRIASPPVSNGEYLAFIAGWRLSPARILAQRWLGPGAGGRLGRAALLAVTTMTAAAASSRWRASSRSIPMRRSMHVSFFEAAAFAAWAGKRLPTEFEWEALAPEHFRHRRGVGMDALFL